MKLLKIYALLLSLSLITGKIFAQVPAPGDPQSQPILLLGGTVHVGNGEVVENAAIAFEQGKITVVGPAASFNEDTSGYEVIRVEGRHVYPGFILPNTDLGLTEISAVRATRDDDETGQLNPNVRSLISYNTDSELIPTMRFNGILLAQTTPQGGIISGSSSVVQLDAWNWEDAVVAADDAIHLHWPGRFNQEFDFSTSTFNRVPNKNYEEQVHTLETLFADAAAYQDVDDPETVNLKLEAMLGLLDGSKALHIYAGKAKEMVESIQFAQQHGVKNIILVGGTEAYLVKDFLKAHNIPVILTNVHSLPEMAGEDVDLPYKLPYLLSEAGILVGLNYVGGSLGSARNLPFLAGTAAAYGLDKEKALQLITANNAKILGIDEEAGTLEVGKRAILFVSEGDALDMRGNQIEKVFIDGRKVTLPALQQRLYEKYKAKYQSH